MEGEEQLQFCAASSSRSPVCSANSSSSSCADVDASAPGPSVWLDMIQELFDLPPPSPSPASDPASTSSLLFLDGGATHAGFDTPYFADAELQQQLQSATAQDSGAASFMPSSSSSAAELQAAPPMDHDDWSLQISGAAEMPVEPFFGSRSFSGSSFLQSNFRSSLHPRDHEQHIFTGAYSFPPTGYALSSSSSAALQTPGGGAGIQKVGSAPQLAYPPFTSSAFSWPTAESSSAAQRQQLIYRHYHHSYESLADMSSASTLSFSPSAGAQYQLNPNAEHSFIKSSARTGFGYPHSALQPPEMTSVQRRKQEVERGLGLVHVLLACAEAVAKGNHETAIALLIQLHPLISKTGSSMQRVAAYFAEALHARLTGIGGRSHAALLNPFFNPTPLNDVLEAYQVLYQACPYIKFAHFTCNQAIFEAFEGEKRVHIVDLDIVQGYQWPAFIQAIAARPGGAPHLRITGVGNSLQAVRDTGKQLSELAEALHVPFEFHAIGERLENLKPHMLQRRVGEALAINSINCLHPLLALPPSNKSLPNLLRMLLEQGPNVFTLVEQEASHNGPFFLGRFLEALHFYSAIFDSLDATLPQHSSDRAKVEMLIFGQEIVNIVACEDVERVKRHEKLETWRTIMETIGFQSVALSANAINQSKILLDLYSCNGYMVKESKGALQLGWQDRLTIGASAWC